MIPLVATRAFKSHMADTHLFFSEFANLLQVAAVWTGRNQIPWAVRKLHDLLFGAQARQESNGSPGRNAAALCR